MPARHLFLKKNQCEKVEKSESMSKRKKNDFLGEFQIPLKTLIFAFLAQTHKLNAELLNYCVTELLKQMTELLK